MLGDIGQLYAQRELLSDFAWRDLRARYKGSLFGFAWNFLNPLLQLLVYYVLFGVILGLKPVSALGTEPAYGYAVFLFTGLLPWTFFSGALQGGAAAVLSNAGLVKKVRLPLQILPAATVLSNLVNFLLALVVLAVVVLASGVPPQPTLAFVPLLLAIEVLLALGFAYALAAVAVFFRDVIHILGIGLTLWYFLTPVIFSLQSIAEKHPTEYFLLHLNPMTPLITGYQRVILDGVAPDWPWLVYSAAVAAAVFLVGFALYGRLSDAFEEAL